MENRAYHPQERRSQILVNEASGNPSPAQFVDNRPETAAHRERQKAADNSPQVSQLKQIQNAANATQNVVQRMKDDGGEEERAPEIKDPRKMVGSPASRMGARMKEISDAVTFLLAEGSWVDIQNYRNYLITSLEARAKIDNKKGHSGHLIRTEQEKAQLHRLNVLGKLNQKQLKAFRKKEAKRAWDSREKTAEELKAEKDARLDLEAEEYEREKKKAQKLKRKKAKEAYLVRKAKKDAKKAALLIPEKVEEKPVEEPELLPEDELEEKPSGRSKSCTDYCALS